MEFGSAVLNDIVGFYNARDKDAFAEKTETLRQKFLRLEAKPGGGPYFAGSSFSLVDAVFGPVFRHFDVFDSIGDFGILEGVPKVMAWRVALAERPSIRSAVPEDDPRRS